jgi:lipoprotein-anchoring transpeptidase ErfK/SrfK
LSGVGWVHVRRISKVWGRKPRTLRSVAVSVAVIAAIAVPPIASARQTALRAPATSSEPNSPLLLIVSIKQQKLHVYDVNGEITSSRVSTGRPGFDTPQGVFSILEKNVHHESNIYSGAEMPYQQRITWSGVALHAGVVPGFRASHGCIRLPYSFSKTLFDITKVGNRVIVSGDDAEPMAFDHPKLFRPLPLDEASAMKSGRMGQQQLAVNDQASGAASDAVEELPRFIGVSPALIRAVSQMPRDPQRRPATRVEADKMMREKITRLQAELKSADNARVSTTDKANAAVKDFAAANDRREAARREIQPLRDAVTAAEKKQRDATRAFEEYMSGASSAATSKSAGGKSDDALDRESELENSVLNLTRDADAARAAVAKSEMSFAEVQARFSAAQSARDAALEAVRQAQFDLQSAQVALADTNKEISRRSRPISVLVSLKSQRVYIRQGFDPLLEAPIIVAPLRGRVGTHVFTAMRYGSDPNTLEWKLVSAQTPSPDQAFDEGADKKKRNRDLPSQARGFSVQMATAALDAFTIPDDILATITELARPGASLIVSDRELPLNENGGGTEFVVLTR